MSVVKIAAEAGVSIATVSRVLNNSRRVNPQLAEQVHRAMKQLNFTPKQIRRRSANKRGDEAKTYSIAIAAVGQRYREWFEIPVIASVVAAVSRFATESNATTMMIDVPEPTDLQEIWRRHQLDGVIMFLDSSISTIDLGPIYRQLPIVRVMGGQMSPLQFDHIAPDNLAIGFSAGEMLLSQGCREIAFLTTRPAWDFSMLRGQGFAAAALAGGVRPHVFFEGPLDNLDCIYGREITHADDLPQLVAKLASAIRARKGDKPMGLFISRDEETVQVHRMLAEQGIHIGKDVSIISCDNERVRLAGLSPMPPSIDLNVNEIARHAINRLIDRIKNPDVAPVRMAINPKLLTADDAAHAG